jgi:hypothetical protein
MSAAPSFEKINYSLRTNKNIERKLLFDGLRKISATIPLNGHRYVGFGSLWFVDFILAHRELSIDDMWSIEIELNGVTRAKFNKPYRSIDVRPGRSSDVLAAMDSTQWEKPLVAWLDYDGTFDETAAADCERILQSCAPNTIYLITVNGERDSYRPRLDSGNRQSAIDTVEKLVGNSADRGSMKAGALDVYPADFRGFLSRSILAFMAETLRITGRAQGALPYSFIPLFEFAHADGALMCTVGGAVVAPSDMALWERHFGTSRERLMAGDAVVRDFIDLKPITLREKIEIDRLLPDSESAVLAAAKKISIGLAPEEIAKYLQWYSRVPIFSESFL